MATCLTPFDFLHTMPAPPACPCSLIPYCLWVHVVFAFYMYGNGSIFPTPKDTSDTFNVADKLEVQVLVVVVAFGLNASTHRFKCLNGPVSECLENLYCCDPAGIALRCRGHRLPRS